MCNFTMELLVKKFKERRTKLNKLQDYKTSFDAWEKWRDIWVISPLKSKISLTLLFLFI